MPCVARAWTSRHLKERLYCKELNGSSRRLVMDQVREITTCQDGLEQVVREAKLKEEKGVKQEEGGRGRG